MEIEIMTHLDAQLLLTLLTWHEELMMSKRSFSTTRQLEILSVLTWHAGANERNN